MSKNISFGQKIWYRKLTFIRLSSEVAGETERERTGVALLHSCCEEEMLFLQRSWNVRNLDAFLGSSNHVYEDSLRVSRELAFRSTTTTTMTLTKEDELAESQMAPPPPIGVDLVSGNLGGSPNAWFMVFISFSK